MHHSTKYHVSLLKNKSGNFTFAKVKFGMYALQALESGILTAQQLEITRRIISRLTKRTSKL
jgi:ribosomal protein L16/L10AE